MLLHLLHTRYAIASGRLKSLNLVETVATKSMVLQVEHSAGCVFVCLFVLTVTSEVT